jgi:hypothetical protein
VIVVFEACGTDNCRLHYTALRSSLQIVTHLESTPAADLHVNLQIGTGGDKYLGPDDIFGKSLSFTATAHQLMSLALITASGPLS